MDVVIDPRNARILVKLASKMKPHVKATVTVQPGQLRSIFEVYDAVELAAEECGKYLGLRYGDNFDLRTLRVEAKREFIEAAKKRGLK